MRLDRPIGIWLLLWPTLWALWIAGEGRPDARTLIIFVAGVVVMRSAGCIINDFADRNVDPHVRRTRTRPLAARRVSPAEALVLFAILSALALWLVIHLNELTIRLALIGAALTISYPFIKRFFAMPQLYLGIAFGWGVPMAFAAQTGEVPRTGWVLLIAAILWAAAYDTLYAMADREDDLRIGVKSSAILFADLDRVAVALLHVAMLCALVLIGRRVELGPWYYAGLIAAALFFVYEQWLVRAREAAACVQAFLNNHYAGLVIFIGIVLDYLYGGGA
jgi:4-hydroxybenzoate polyprenyltransferase